MQINNSFTVPVGIQETWELMLDVDRITPCMPGAQLTEKREDGSFLGKVDVKLGPMAMSFKGEATFDEVDEATRTIKLSAKGREARGRGSAKASVTSSLEEGGGQTTVNILTELQLSGGVAQFGRGMIGDISNQLVGQFADCLAAQLGGSQDGPERATAAADAQQVAAKPVAGFKLLFAALRARLRRLFRRDGLRGS